jgi:hypothetical protein
MNRKMAYLSLRQISCIRPVLWQYWIPLLFSALFGWSREHANDRAVACYITHMLQYSFRLAQMPIWTYLRLDIFGVYNWHRYSGCDFKMISWISRWLYRGEHRHLLRAGVKVDMKSYPKLARNVFNFRSIVLRKHGSWRAPKFTQEQKLCDLENQKKKKRSPREKRAYIRL